MSASAAHILKLDSIQRRLAWPLRKDDTQLREAYPVFNHSVERKKKRGGKRVQAKLLPQTVQLKGYKKVKLLPQTVQLKGFSKIKVKLSSQTTTKGLKKKKKKRSFY